MNNMDNELMSIPLKNIFLEFLFEDELYSVLSKEEVLEEGDEVYFAKVKFVDDVKVFIGIDSDEEYNRVAAEFQKILKRLGDVDNYE
jgi:hypothetical protein